MAIIPPGLPIEPGTAGYSDLAAASDGTIFCLYERGGIKDMFDTGFLTLARVPPHWLTEDTSNSTKKAP